MWGIKNVSCQDLLLGTTTLSKSGYTVCESGKIDNFYSFLPESLNTREDEIEPSGIECDR